MNTLISEKSKIEAGKKNAKICYEESFGTWVHNLWYTNMTSIDEGYTFQDEKEIFFRTFQLLLEEGKIIVTSSRIFKDEKYRAIEPLPHIPQPILVPFPKDPRYSYWNAEAKYIVDHIRRIFPKDATKFDDEIVGDWFYGTYGRLSSCPWIGWVDQETGEVTAS